MVVRLITFDLDETLWDTPSILASAEKKMLAWLDAEVPSFSEAYLGNQETVRHSILADRPNIHYDFNKIRIAVIEEVLGQCDVTPVDANELARSALCIFHGERNSFETYEGAEQLLRDLSEKYVLASLSNGTSEVYRMSLGNYFELSLYASDIGVRKPNPVLFQLIFNHTGVSPAESVHVGDHPIEDIEVAAKLGMKTVQIERPEREISPLADKSVSELGEVYEAIVELDQ
ncbi:MAG: HAD family hydrolase [Gammaproteobacteria bacterium]|nr:HAD family hydrolase [Gammaproteobacteria bacterium]